MKPTSPLLFALLLLLTGSVLAETSDYKIGAKIFHDRCVLCHGGRGMGEGFLPLKLENYPNTNLLANAKVTDREKVFNIIARGGSLEKVSEFMPPMGNELTFQELNTVTDFVLYLRTDSSAAAELLTQAASLSNNPHSLKNINYIQRAEHSPENILSIFLAV